MCCFIWLPSWTFCLGSSVGESNSLFPTNITSFVIGQQRTWVQPDVFLSTRRRVTVCTKFFSSVSIVTILAIGHWICWHLSFNSTISPTVKFGVCFFHFCLGCRLWRNSFLHLLQNFSTICWTRHHRFLEYKSGRLNSPGGGMTMLDFYVRRFLGDIGVGLFASFRVSIVRGLEFTNNSALVIKVVRDLPFKDKLWVCKSQSNMFLAVRIWCSQMPPICDTAGGLWCRSVQSALFSDFILIHFLESLLQLISCPRKICSIAWPNGSNSTSSCHEPSKCED